MRLVCSGRLQRGSPSPRHGQFLPAESTPGTQASGVSQQVRRRAARQSGPYTDVSEDGAGDAGGYPTPGSDAHYPPAGAHISAHDLAGFKYFALACTPERYLSVFMT